MLKYVKAFRNIVQEANPQQRRRLMWAIQESLKADHESSEGMKWIKSITKSETIGFTMGVEWVDKSDLKFKGLAFNAPALLLNDKRYPALWILGPDVTTDYKPVPVVKSPDVRDRYSWVDIIRKANKSQLNRLMKCVFQAQTLFNAKWRLTSTTPPRWDLVRQNEEAIEFSENLKNTKTFDLMGFCTHNAYYRLFGDKVQLEAEWLHALSGPALLYRHKKLPLYLVAGFDIMFNNSIVGDITENSMREDLFGITG